MAAHRGQRDGRSGLGRFGRASLCAGLVATAVGACSGPSLDASGAASAYRPVVEAVTTGTGTALGVEWTRASAETTQPGDAGCTWYSTSFETPTDLSGRLPELRRALDTALAGRGFSGAQDAQLEGGWVAATATDGADATVSVQSKGRSTMRVTVPVRGDC